MSMGANLFVVLGFIILLLGDNDLGIGFCVSGGFVMCLLVVGS